MGCFLGCFGSSKDAKKRRKQRYKVLPRDQKNATSKPLQPRVPLVQESSQNLPGPVTELQDKPAVKVSSCPKKKVTFDSNVKTYEPVLREEVNDFPLKSEESGNKVEELAKSSQSKSISDDVSSVTSSTGSYPPNHRYQNCGDSDDEYGEELDYEGTDLSDDEDDSDEDEVLDARTEVASAQVISEECLSDEEVKPMVSYPGARDRSAYVHSVLNPVENISQWKALKAKGKPPLRTQKENSIVNQETLEPCFKELQFSFKSKTDPPKILNQEVAVDASLSNWLVSSKIQPANNTPERSISQGSNSVISHEDRPILGALTVEELKQFSATSSPMKSPSQSPDDMPIIGTVGTYWSHSGTVEDAGSPSSFKGIPNSTSKYREDKRVNWHSTPFETRLERALNTSAVETRASGVF